MRDSPARGSTADKLNAHEAKETNGDERTEVSRRKIGKKNKKQNHRRIIGE